jgi:hypothetical protein
MRRYFLLSGAWLVAAIALMWVGAFLMDGLSYDDWRRFPAFMSLFLGCGGSFVASVFLFLHGVAEG